MKINLFYRFEVEIEDIFKVIRAKFQKFVDFGSKFLLLFKKNSY